MNRMVIGYRSYSPELARTAAMIVTTMPKTINTEIRAKSLPYFG